MGAGLYGIDDGDGLALDAGLRGGRGVGFARDDGANVGALLLSTAGGVDGDDEGLGLVGALVGAAQRHRHRPDRAHNRKRDRRHAAETEPHAAALLAAARARLRSARAFSNAKTS